MQHKRQAKKIDNSRFGARHRVLVKMAQVKVIRPKPKKQARFFVTSGIMLASVSETVNDFFIEKGLDFFQASLGLACLLLGILVVDKQKRKRRVFEVERNAVRSDVDADVSGDTTVAAVAEPSQMEQQVEEKKQTVLEDRKVIEEMFLKDDELSTFNFKPVTEIMERRKYPRADLRNSRGVLARALVGSKTQPFKKIRISDISKGGLSFIVGSNDTKFKTPTMVKLYFADSSKPVDLWVRVIWERQEFGGGGKRVGVRFTKVPRETWKRSWVPLAIDWAS